MSVAFPRRHWSVGTRDVWEAANWPLLKRSCIHPIIHPSSLPIARLKTIWPFVAGGIALVVTALKDWLFGQK